MDAPVRVARVALGLALLLLAGVVGYELGARDEVPGEASIDVGFLQDMIAHHEQALELSNDELLHGAEERIRAFAREILLFQSYEIGLMEKQLGEWGYERAAPERVMGWMGASVPAAEMPGLASPEELRALGLARGRDSDALFVALMRDHHRGGIHMAEYATERATDPFVRDLAARMARNQLLEIKEMEIARDQAGLPAAPVGYEA